LEQSWPRLAKLALRIDGAMMAGGDIVSCMCWEVRRRGRGRYREKLPDDDV
jgi:hypothetical protein